MLWRRTLHADHSLHDKVTERTLQEGVIRAELCILTGRSNRVALLSNF